MQTLAPLAEQVAACLKARGQTLAVAESSTGGLLSAALLAVPGASAYFLGGAVVYTKAARAALLQVPAEAMTGIRSASPAYAALLADTIRARLGADWALAETGAAGPTGNGYGDPAGHTCLHVAGSTPAAHTLRTGETDRAANMERFAAAALELLLQALA